MMEKDTQMACAFFAGMIMGWTSRMEGNPKLKKDMLAESKRLAKLGKVKLKL